MENLEARANNIAVLDGLAMQAQTFATNIAANLIQLGRVFTEAKPLVKHGEWVNWVQENSGMSARYAQNCMAAYERYGGKPEFEKLGKSNLFAMLALPEGTEEEFIKQNDVAEMSAREVQEAVKKVREEMNAQLDKEHEIRLSAEKRVRELENSELPEEVTRKLNDQGAEIERLRNECDSIAENARSILNEKNAAAAELAKAQRDLKDSEKMLEDAQEDYKQLQTELLDAKSTLARGADPKVSEHMSAALFSDTIRNFIAAVAQIPYMSKTFAAMNSTEHGAFDIGLKTVEDWCKRARSAIDSVGGEIYG